MSDFKNKIPSLIFKKDAKLQIGFLEAWGIKFILNSLRNSSKKNKSINSFNFDSENIYQPIQKFIYLAIFFSFLVGFLTTFCIVAIEMTLPQEPIFLSQTFIVKWLIQIISLIVFTGVEFYLLYLIGFYYLAKIANYMELVVIDDPILVTNNKNVLARLILEIPDHRLNLLNIDPYRMVNKHSLFFQTILYKLKVFLSNFIAKILIRKILTRSSLRLYADFIIAPVTALWDGIVTYIIFKEVKQRLFSRKLTEEFLFKLLGLSQFIDDSLKDILIRVVANSIVLNQKFHPNLEFLLLKLYAEFYSSVREEVVLDDWDYFIATISSQNELSKKLICLMFNFCCAIDGKFSGLEKKVILESELLSRKENILSIEELKNYITKGNFNSARKFISLLEYEFKSSDLVWN